MSANQKADMRIKKLINSNLFKASDKKETIRPFHN